jgi:tetratricopeptide (TPR) repeat protein
VKRQRDNRPEATSRPLSGRRASRGRLYLLLALLLIAGGAWAWQRQQRQAALASALAAGRAALSRHDSETASRAFRRVLRIDPRHSEARTRLGRLALEQGDTEAAVAHFSAVAKRKPRDVVALCDLGIAHVESGDWPEAIAAFQQATRVEPGSALALRGLGEAYRRSQRLTEAVATLEEAYRREPEDARGVYLLALATAQRGHAPDDPRRALDLLRKARRMGAPQAPVQYAMGLAYLAQGQSREAVAALEAALRGQPGDDQALFHLGQAYRRAGRLELARKTLAEHAAREGRRQRLRGLKERVAAQPDSREHRRRLAEACVETGDYQGALQHLAILSNAGAEDAALYDLYARAWDGLGLKVPADQARALAEQSRGEASSRTLPGAK